MYLEALYDFPLGKEPQLLQCVEIFRNIFWGYSLVDPNIKQPAIWMNWWWLAKVFPSCFAFWGNQKSRVHILIQCFIPQTNRDMQTLELHSYRRSALNSFEFVLRAIWRLYRCANRKLQCLYQWYNFWTHTILHWKATDNILFMHV